MYFKDLTPYKYHNSEIEMKNIAWLEKGHLFKKGDVPSVFKDKLWKYMSYPVSVCRGFQRCPFCSLGKNEIPTSTYNGQTRSVGYYELRVWGKDDTVYAVTSLIFHYMESHRYKPPIEFIEAVMNSDDPDNADYYNRVLSMENGHDFWLGTDRTLVDESKTSYRTKGSFPDTLNNAKVLFYTPKGNYGDLLYDDGTIAAHFAYMAICKYDGDSGFYLFKCNENIEIETDNLFDSINECMKAKAAGSNDTSEISWISKTDDTYSNYQLSVEVTFFSGQRKYLPSTGYRPDAVFEGYDDNELWGIFFSELDVVGFDKPVFAKMRFSLQTYHYHQVWVGQRFTIKEGAKTVGEGKIVEYIIS